MSGEREQVFGGRRRRLTLRRRTRRRQSIAAKVTAASLRNDVSNTGRMEVEDMTSDKQNEANRASAQKSTGPRTKNGKAKSRLNAMKHGLTGRLIAGPGEDAAEFDRLKADLFEDLRPMGAFEDRCVASIAEKIWRLNRVPSWESAVIMNGHHRHASRKFDVEGMFGTPKSEKAADEKMAALYPDRDASEREHCLHAGQILDELIVTLNRLGGYEAKVARQLKQDWDLLRQAQAERTARAEEPLQEQDVAADAAADDGPTPKAASSEDAPQAVTH